MKQVWLSQSSNSTLKSEDIRVGMVCLNCGCKRVREEREEKPQQRVNTESVETICYTSAQPTKRGETKDVEEANVVLRARFNQLQERGLIRREWDEMPRDNIDMQQALNIAKAPHFIQPILRPIEVLYIDVLQGLRSWATPSPYQDEHSRRGTKMQYPRQLRTLQFSR